MGNTVSGCDNVFALASFQAPPTTNRRETGRASYLRKEGTVVCGQHGEFRASYGSEHHIACTGSFLFPHFSHLQLVVVPQHTVHYLYQSFTHFYFSVSQPL